LVAAFLIGTPCALAGKSRIAVIGLSMGDVTAEVRVKMNAAIVGGLIASGADVADSTTTGRAMAERGMVACDTATCLTEIGKATGATYLMRGSMEMIGRSYVVRLEMIDAVSATVISSREDRCEICTENEAYETASVSASALKSDVFKRRSSPSPSPSRAGAGARTPGASDRSVVRSPSFEDRTLILTQQPETPALEMPPPESPRASQTPWRPLGWTAVGVAVAAIATGITLIAIDNGGNCSASGGDPSAMCTGHKTLTGGIALTAVGFAAAAASMVSFTRHF
jgi:hypothetical protein